MPEAQRVHFNDDDLVWWKSTRSGGASNDCVAWAVDGEELVLRDTKLGDGGPKLRLSSQADILAFRDFARNFVAE